MSEKDDDFYQSGVWVWQWVYLRVSINQWRFPSTGQPLAVTCVCLRSLGLVSRGCSVRDCVLSCSWAALAPLNVFLQHCVSEAGGQLADAPVDEVLIMCW